MSSFGSERLGTSHLTQRSRPASSTLMTGAVRSLCGLAVVPWPWVPIHGVIAHRADSFDASSGGTSAELIGALLNQAVNDQDVMTIVLDFSTPGGSVEGIPELAERIALAASVKRVVAHVNALAASAGYWLASQASEVVITPSGQVGSIGVFMFLVDESKALESEGITINAISAGKFKLEGAWWEPLSDEARAHFQAQVTAVHRAFLSAVAKGRGVSVQEVQQRFGEGRVFNAEQALSRLMVDRIETLDATFARLDPAVPRSSRSSVRACHCGACTRLRTKSMITDDEQQLLDEHLMILALM